MQLGLLEDDERSLYSSEPTAMLALSETSGAMVNWINSYAISDIANIAALLQNLGIGIGWMYHFRTSRPEGGRPPPRDHLVDVRAEREARHAVVLQGLREEIRAQVVRAVVPHGRLIPG